MRPNQYAAPQQDFNFGGMDGSHSKKVINVSIDLIKEGELD